MKKYNREPGKVQKSLPYSRIQLYGNCKAAIMNGLRAYGAIDIRYSGHTRKFYYQKDNLNLGMRILNCEMKKNLLIGTLKRKVREVLAKLCKVINNLRNADFKFRN